MHEIRIAQELAAIVTGVAKENGLKEVTKATLQFGEMIQVVPDILRFAFAEAVRGTLAENAEIEMEILPVMLQCNQCRSTFVIREQDFHCAQCNSGDLRILQGKEMFVKSIEGE
jgi:hydrogenase nickel incorporation protein HypA/HybF